MELKPTYIIHSKNTRENRSGNVTEGGEDTVIVRLDDGAGDTFTEETEDGVKLGVDDAITEGDEDNAMEGGENAVIVGLDDGAGDTFTEGAEDGEASC